MIQTLDKIIDKKKLWTKYYIMIVIFNLFVSIAHSMMVSTIPLYAMHIGGNNSTAGMVMGVFTISALLFRPVFGTILDTKGRKIVLVIGSILFFIGTLFQSLAGSIAVLLFLRFIQGIGFSANSTASGTVVADLVPTSRLSEGIGYFGIAATLATAIGPALGLEFIKQSGYGHLFLGATSIMSVGLLIAVFLNYETKSIKNLIVEKPVNKKKLGPSKNLISKLKVLGIFEKSAMPPAFVVFFTALAFGSVIIFLPVYAVSQGIENIGLFYIVYAGAILITRLFTGKMADRIGITLVILPAMALMTLALAILAFSETLPILLVVGVLFGLGFGTIQPLLNTLILNSCSAEKRGAANAVYFSAMDIGLAIGSIFWGVVSQWFGFTSVYLASAGCIVISGVAYLLLICKKKSSSV